MLAAHTPARLVALLSTALTVGFIEQLPLGRARMEKYSSLTTSKPGVIIYAASNAFGNKKNSMWWSRRQQGLLLLHLTSSKALLLLLL
mmetsp:Transcript_59833/g.69276  ORF Transcript_59833/g.69276 Transcript_59833/m.69276 type:complete len:88 (-) Transcript_59833:287-550(-)